MSSWQFVLRGLAHHWRINLAVALGVAATTAVLVGALLVGDSVRGSLRSLTLDRLGKIDALLIAEHYFREQIVADLVTQEPFTSRFQQAEPALIFPRGTVEFPGSTKVRRASQVLVVGCRDTFWNFDVRQIRPLKMPRVDEVVLNQALASDLGVQIGEQVVIRLPQVNEIPAESPLGEKEDRIRGITELKVVSIIPTKGLGRFSLTPSQSAPRTAFLSLETLQEPLDVEGKVNAILVSGNPQQPLPSQTVCDELSTWLDLTFADYGFNIRRVTQTFPRENPASEEIIFDYFSFTSDKMVIEDQAARIADKAFKQLRGIPTFTYLANALVKLDEDGNEIGAAIPYSTVASIDIANKSDLSQERAASLNVSFSENGIGLNRWTADQLQAQVGDSIRLYYFEPETTHGRPQERQAEFVVETIIPFTEPGKPFTANSDPVFTDRPTWANDTHFTPEVKGITDQDSISNWQTPFQLTREVRDVDETYYDNHRLTPKAFLDLATAQQLWGSRFGKVTSYRIPVQETLEPGQAKAFVSSLENAFVQYLHQEKVRLGLEFRPVKAQSLQASSGTTPFDGLFLALSFFIIAAALMLVSLLFQLGIEQRADEIGILLATGFRRQQIGRLLTAEGSLVTLIGGLLGIGIGIAYAWLMLAGLTSEDWWLGALVAPFLEFHITLQSVFIGYLLGALCCIASIRYGVRRTRHVATRRLLAGQMTDSLADFLVAQQQRSIKIPLGLLMTALLLATLGTRWGGELQAATFVSSGAILLTAILLLVHRQFRLGSTQQNTRRWNLSQLSRSNAARNPGRSTLIIGLIATASFLIVGMSCFRLSPSVAGTGGFDLIAESSEPVFADMNTVEGREDLLLDTEESLDFAEIFSLRVQPGDDASCNNLYKASRPQILGVTAALVKYFDDPEQQGFSWASSAAETADEKTNPWRLLNKPIANDTNVVPVVIDKNTAMYSLGMYFGIGEQKEFTYHDGRKVRFQVVGLLANSVLQGNLLIGDKYFKERFAHSEGYQFFLIKSKSADSINAPLKVTANQDSAISAGRMESGLALANDSTQSSHLQAISDALENALSDQGFDVEPARKRLENLLAVQNTYLSTFQSLGALGLLLGTFGLATVQLRSILERRAELALLRSSGFRRSRLAQLVMLENLLLLFGGLTTGVFAALFSVLPHMYFGDASVPFRDLIFTLSIVLAVGICTSLLTIRATLRAPVVAALRGD